MANFNSEPVNLPIPGLFQLFFVLAPASARSEFRHLQPRANRFALRLRAVKGYFHKLSGFWWRSLAALVLCVMPVACGTAPGSAKNDANPSDAFDSASVLPDAEATDASGPADTSGPGHETADAASPADAAGDAGPPGDTGLSDGDGGLASDATPQATDAADASANDSVDAAPEPTPTLVKVVWKGMPPPQTALQKASIYSEAQAVATWSDGKVTTTPLSHQLLFRTGDLVAGQVAAGLHDALGKPLLDPSVPSKPQYAANAPDGTTLLAIAGMPPTSVGPALVLVTQFEFLSADAAGAPKYGQLPMAISAVLVGQQATGGLAVFGYHSVDMAPALGLWLPCAASRSPWNTHLASEEYEPDARCVQAGGCPLLSMQSFFGNPSTPRPYHYGHAPEVTVQADGKAKIVKHFVLGRISREIVQVMPDERTVYMGDDATRGGLFLFVADKPADLSAGTLYAGKWKQVLAPDGGAAKLTWVRLGHATDAEIIKLAATLQFNDIYETSPGPKFGFQQISTLVGTEWLIRKPAMEQGAAFLETRREAAMRGATTEFQKMEGVAVDAKKKRLYVALSVIGGGMSGDGVPPDHIKVSPRGSGAVYGCHLLAGQKDSDGKAIASDWVAIDMQALLLGQDLKKPDAAGNTADPELVANPDNLAFATGLRTLFVGEDSSMHVNNSVWAWHVDSGALARVLSLPAGAEATGLNFAVHGGFGYLTANFQHAVGSSAMPAAEQAAVAQELDKQWGVTRKSGVGVLRGLPAP